MVDEGDTRGAAWPLPKFYFSVQLGDDRDVKFSEVIGLEVDATLIAHRDSKVFHPIKMPGLGGVTNVTMRKGIVAKDAKFWVWLSEIKMNIITGRAVVIGLMDETGQSQMVWTLHNAWPVKVTGADLKSEGNEVAVESIEFAYEALEVKAA
jgi:phage tail-like protein